MVSNINLLFKIKAQNMEFFFIELFRVHLNLKRKPKNRISNKIFSECISYHFDKRLKFRELFLFHHKYVCDQEI